ncbi:hypothetical protein IGI37_000148 [Enterococcus sp. AZ194]|uniref:helix-turn-helix domain-containing protein n=1 Tax=Enterococcus sp. AZ194 TaxID=2774629 RepID=UPI003F27C570
MELGEKVKQLRNKKKMTIKEMSKLTGLSTGFISQFERGITTIDVKHLDTIAEILDTDITTFFSKETQKNTSLEQDIIVRRYNRPYVQQVNRVVHFDLGHFSDQLTMSPEYIEIMPNETKEIPASYTHEGEEFIFVLEGVLTFSWDDEDIRLYPGDSAHFPSDHPHNWDNMSDTIAKVIIVHAPRIN